MKRDELISMISEWFMDASENFDKDVKKLKERKKTWNELPNTLTKDNPTVIEIIDDIKHDIMREEQRKKRFRHLLNADNWKKINNVDKIGVSRNLDEALKILNIKKS